MVSHVSTSRSARSARWLAVPVGLVISAVLIWQASYAAFSDTTVDAGNSWTAGTVKISDTGGEQPMFSAGNLAPGRTESRTITASYEGSLDAQVSFYGRKFAEPAPNAEGKTLADFIELTIEGTAGPAFGVGDTGVIYEGTLANFGRTRDSFTDGLLYTAAGGAPVEQGTFRFTYRIKDEAPNSVQGQQVTIDFVAEAQSTR